MKTLHTRLCLGRLVAAAMAVASALAAPAMDVREALGHFETGAAQPTRCAADAKIGSRQEVSRFQILPTVWRRYSSSAEYENPDVAWNVARRILEERRQTFRRATGRECDGVDLYILWNAPGLYQRSRWDRGLVSPVVLERAQRFANLLEHDHRALALGR